MFQNDDMDMVAEKVNPANPNQVWHGDGWVDLQQREETIRVKGQAPVKLTLRHSPHGPIINDAFTASLGRDTPVALWWTFQQSDNPLLQAFHELNRADTLAKARSAASQLHAPGLNIVWANAAGDIGWWTAARLPRRPEHVHPSFILNGATGEADKPGFYDFADNPQEENPARGYIVSANHQPVPANGMTVPGYYNLRDRAQHLDRLLRQPGVQWRLDNSRALQLDTGSGYAGRVLAPLLAVLREVATAPDERALLERLAAWDGRYEPGDIAPTLFSQLQYQVLREAMADELDDTAFHNLLKTRVVDDALPRLLADPDSPWWDRRGTAPVETRRDIVRDAWRASLAHLRSVLGAQPQDWTWGRAHRLTHGHVLGRQEPLHLLFNVGPFPAPGGRDVPNNLFHPLGPAPWQVAHGPSTRRLIDFADPARSLGINPVGQSGVLLDPHRADQAEDYIAGRYRPQHLDDGDIRIHTRSTLRLLP